MTAPFIKMDSSTLIAMIPNIFNNNNIIIGNSFNQIYDASNNYIKVPINTTGSIKGNTGIFQNINTNIINMPIDSSSSIKCYLGNYNIINASTASFDIINITDTLISNISNSTDINCSSVGVFNKISLKDPNTNLYFDLYDKIKELELKLVTLENKL